MDGTALAPHQPRWLPDADRPERPVTPLAVLYVDTATAEGRTIGVLHEALSRHPAPVPEGCFLLHTCQRIEVYGAPPVPGVVDLPVGTNWTSTTSETHARRRLVEIAVGLRSELLGERFIHHQVRTACSRLDATHPLRPVVTDALATADRLRRDHGFTAHADYPELALRVLSGTSPPAVRTRLVIVGSGMLAKAVSTSAVGAGYELPVMVTRSPKRLRRRRLIGDAPVLATTVRGAPEVIGPADWVAVVATTNLSGEHRDRVQALIEDRRCRGAVDLSCVPVLPDAPEDGRYLSMYGARFRGLVTEQNARLAETAARVTAAIAARSGAGR